MRKGKEKKKGEPKFYFRTDWVKGEMVYLPYIFALGEKEEYENTCLETNGWCGIPMDVNWAKSTNSYIETKRKREEQDKIK